MKRSVITVSIFTSIIFILSGCSANTGADSNILTVLFVDPFTFLIESTASLFDGSFGVSIILITLLIRLLLMPFMVKQQKNQKQMKEKMAVIKPEIDKIQSEIKKTEDRGKQRELQQEMMGLYSKHGVNPLSMGCLPLIIQAPVLMGFYYAIQSSTEIATHNFLWFSLGVPNIPLAILAGIIYFVQFKVQQKYMPIEQKGNPMMRWMGLISPIMILVISFSMPAALPLYWSVSGTFLIIQTIIVNYEPATPVESN
ncbi:membrane protein insertase YidC [Virgibacillus flavescens]|uniref:membrane protein insertase YidC n=1 Tax=Virgibacillus flavescens TaxID=1611422 RepID=UPI003D32E0D6